MHTYRVSSHGNLFSGCFRMLHHMSAASPKFFQDIRDFEKALSHQLEALDPDQNSENKRILRMSWLASALDLALEKHKEAVSLIPPLEFPLLVCDEKWMSDYMDQTARMLDLCNALTTVICNIEQGHLLIRHACHVLLKAEKSPSHEHAPVPHAASIIFHEEQLSRAHRSLHEWLEMQTKDSPTPKKYSPILQDMIKGLVPPKDKAVAKGKGFLYALYGANATIVFVFYVFSLAVSHESELLSLSLLPPSVLLWSASLSHLMQVAKDEAKECTSANFCFEDLLALERRVKDLLAVLEHAINLNSQPLLEEDAKRLAGAVTELSLDLDDIAKKLELVGTKLNEMFKAVVASRSALLDKLGDFGTDEL